MARDWIKMRIDLWDHPKVVRILSAICPQSVRDMSMKCRVIGALYRTWAIADTHTSDGVLDGYDAEALNAAIGIDGWAENMQHVGWLVIEPQRLIVPRFEEHNGESAKKRAEDSARKRRVRETSAICPRNVREMSAENRTREEKRRIDTNVSIGRAPKATFTPPNVDQVRAYCLERNNGIDAEAFVAHYASSGWKVGSKKMTDWQMAVITWERNKAAREGAAKPAPVKPRIPTDEELLRWNPTTGLD